MASARKLPSGSWRVRIYVGKKPDGTPDYKSFTADTKREAEYLAAQYNITRKEKPKCKLTVHQAIEKYIDNKSNVLSPSTIRGYRSCLKKDYEKIGAVKVCDLDADTVQRFVNSFTVGHSPKTVKNVYTLLQSSVLECDPDCQISAKLPQRQKASITIPTSEQIKALLARLERTPNVLCAVLVAAILGLRRGEICALEWGDIRGGKLHVNKAMAMTDKSTWVVKTPKTKSGTRAVALPDYLEKRLLALKQENRQDERIFHMTPNTLTDAFIDARNALGFSFRFHDLRHYNASIMVYLGVPEVNAMERMGHSTPNMIKSVYMHIVEEKKSEVDDKISAFMGASLLSEKV